MIKRINGRAFVSISIFLSFWVMLITSILMFVNRHTTLTSMTHTVLGFMLLLLVLWHMKNNFSPLKQHLKLHPRAGKTHFNWALPLALVFSCSVIALALVQFRPFLMLYEWGNSVRAGKSKQEEDQFTYARIDKTPANATGIGLTIDVRTGLYFAWPQYAIWLETMDGKFIQPLFVTGKLAKNNFSVAVTRKDNSLVFTSNPMTSAEYDQEQIFAIADDPATAEQRMRPESLPVFLHKSNPTGEASPGRVNDSTVDAYTGATMFTSFLLSSKTILPLASKYKVRMEINQSFDFNDFYSSDRFPDDPIYSGNGYSAQPSVVYEAIVDSASTQKYYSMELVGRGHHSGKDGELYGDLTNLTTALAMIDRIIVEVDGH